MPLQRRKISAVSKEFKNEIKRLKRFDADNQKRFNSRQISTVQLHFLTEAIFFRAFRAYERLLRDLFLLYCQEKLHSSGRKAKSYLQPRNFLHSELLIKSSLKFLDWNNPDIVIQRAELYLMDGFPFKIPLNTYRSELHDYRKIRNHIAHDSYESWNGYLSVLRKYYRTIPLRIPPPGEFLLLRDRTDPAKYKLLVFFDIMENLNSYLS